MRSVQSPQTISIPSPHSTKSQRGKNKTDAPNLQICTSEIFWQIGRQETKQNREDKKVEFGNGTEVLKQLEWLGLESKVFPKEKKVQATGPKSK